MSFFKNLSHLIYFHVQKTCFFLSQCVFMPHFDSLVLFFYLKLSFTLHFSYSHLNNLIFPPAPAPHTPPPCVFLPRVTVLQARRLSATLSVDIKAFAVSKADERQEEGGRGQACKHTAANTANTAKTIALNFFFFL